MPFGGRPARPPIDFAPNGSGADELPENLTLIIKNNRISPL